jgi:hypothetical protein
MNRFPPHGECRRDIPQGLKPQFSGWLERPKAEALGYLEAKSSSLTPVVLGGFLGHMA